MAEQYSVGPSYQTVDVQSQTEAVDVQAVTIYTKPHATRVTVLVPLSVWQAGKANDYLAPVAKNIEQVWTDGFILGAQGGQDVDPATNLLVFYCYFTVFFNPGTGLAQPLTTVVPVPVKSLSSLQAFTVTGGANAYGQQIADAYDQLAATYSL